MMMMMVVMMMVMVLMTMMMAVVVSMVTNVPGAKAYRLITHHMSPLSPK